MEESRPGREAGGSRWGWDGEEEGKARESSGKVWLLFTEMKSNQEDEAGLVDGNRAQGRASLEREGNCTRVVRTTRMNLSQEHGVYKEPISRRRARSSKMRTETRISHLSIGLMTAQDVIVHISLLVFSEMLYTGLQGEKQERRKNKSFATLRTAQAALAIAGRKVRVRGRRYFDPTAAEKTNHSLRNHDVLEEEEGEEEEEEKLSVDKTTEEESLSMPDTFDRTLMPQDDLGDLLGYLASECGARPSALDPQAQLQAASTENYVHHGGDAGQDFVPARRDVAVNDDSLPREALGAVGMPSGIAIELLFSLAHGYVPVLYYEQ
eukprot:748993-Hanusia_phi.AAC.4